MTTFREIIHNQLFVTIPNPDHDFTNQVCIVTGSNTGLGKEAARKLVTSNASKVILAVRNTSKGEAAKRDIEASTNRHNVVEVWELDLCSFDSVKRFATRCEEELDGLDLLICNAGINTRKYEEMEGNESMLTVNVLSTFLLAILLLPLCRRSARTYDTQATVTIVASDLHALASLPERNEPSIFDALNADKSFSGMGRRYGVTKLLVVLLTRELAARMRDSERQGVALNCANPGFCYSDLTRSVPKWSKPIFWVMHKLMARSTEEGSRAHIIAASGGRETHGEYMDNGVVALTGTFVRSEDGEKAQKKVYEELIERLEVVEPGISTKVTAI